jgi:hypothetical protein
MRFLFHAGQILNIKACVSLLISILSQLLNPRLFACLIRTFPLHAPILDVCRHVMLNPTTLIAASAAIALLTEVCAGPLALRNEEPPQPACTSPFQPFVYAGCFSDPSSPRGLLYSSGLPTQNMTVETCVAYCKGMPTSSYSQLLPDMYRQRLQVCWFGILWRVLLRCFGQWCSTPRERLLVPLHGKLERGLWWKRYSLDLPGSYISSCERQYNLRLPVFRMLLGGDIRSLLGVDANPTEHI